MGFGCTVGQQKDIELHRAASPKLKIIKFITLVSIIFVKKRIGLAQHILLSERLMERRAYLTQELDATNYRLLTTSYFNKPLLYKK